MDILFTAQKQKQEDALYMRWINGVQFQMSFEDFKAQCGWNRIWQRNERRFNTEEPKEQTEEEILAQVKSIIG